MLEVDAPSGPSSDEEAALLAQDTEIGGSLNAAMADAPAEPGELPPMEDLVKRIPAPAREMIEELFRARFVTVKRVPKSALKS